MGTKRPTYNLFDTLSNINTSDRKLQPGGKISRDPSPRPAITAQSERERDGNREDDRRREREKEKMRDKTRFKDIDPQERYYDRATAPRMREDEREWREREWWREDDRSRNGRPVSNVERDTDREIGRGVKKGDTFPRMRKSSAERGGKFMSTTEIPDERGERRQRDRRTETHTWERDRGNARPRERNRDMERDDIQTRAKEGGKKRGTRPLEDEKLRLNERYQESDAFPDRGREVGDSWARRERDALRRGEKQRPTTGEREAWMSSPHRQRDTDIYSHRKDREDVGRREGRRDTRSEGDNDEREFRRERVRDREREEVIYQHSRSEGDDVDRRLREKDQNRQRYREEDRQRHKDGDREQEVDRPRRRGVETERERHREIDRRGERVAAREGERWTDSGRGVKDDRGRSNDGREGGRYSEYEQRRDKQRRERDTDPRWDDTAGRSNQSLNKTAPRVPPRSQSSGEWSSDVDSERRHKRGRDSYEEPESGRDRTTERKRHVEEQRDPERAGERSQREQKKSDRQERDRGEMTGSMPEQRRMWLEPQRGKNSKEEFLDRERHTRLKEKGREEERPTESRAEWSREGQQGKEELDERYLDQSSNRPKPAERNDYYRYEERETRSVNVDEEELWRETDQRRQGHQSDSHSRMEGSERRNVKGEKLTDNTDESDREEEGGIDYLVSSKKGGGSESGRKQERDSILSTEDGFVTVSSGGDEEDEEYEDCQEYWEQGVRYDDSSPVGLGGNEERENEWAVGKEEAVDEGERKEEKTPKYVFCVIGQTLPRSKGDTIPPPKVDQTGFVERDNVNLEMYHHCSNDDPKQTQDDLHVTLSRNDEYPIINNQEPTDKSEHDTSREEKATSEKTTEVAITYRSSSELPHTETEDGLRSKAEHPYAEIGQIKRDSQTERLLTEWREKNKELADQRQEQVSPLPNNPYADVCSQANFEEILDGLNTGAMSPEEVEAIRIRLSGAWSMSEEPKRHSQAPHLKWAKNVVREILGHSDEQIVDEPSSKWQGDHMVNQAEKVIEDDKEQEEVSHKTGEITGLKLTREEEPYEPELEDGEPLVMEGLRGMGQSQADMHADQFSSMHADTPSHTHADTLLDTQGKEDQKTDKETGPSADPQLKKADAEVKVTQEAGEEVTLSEIEKQVSGEKEVEMYLSVSNTLYKPNSCPILNYESDLDIVIPSSEGKSLEEEDRMSESEEEGQGEGPEERGTMLEEGNKRVGEENEVGSREGQEVAESKTGETLTSTCSFRELGPEARVRRRGIRKTAERRRRRSGELVEVEEEEEEEEEEEGVGRDRRTRIFSTTDDEDDRSKSWGEVELRNVLDTIERRKRNSRFFNAAQLYQQYSEAAQNFEILRQSRSDVLSVCEDHTSSPAPSPPPARRPLPPIPPVPHPHSLAYTGSVTSVKSLPLPEPPKCEGRPSSPRLSVSLTQSSTLWRDLPGVRNSGALEELTEDQRRLQEVRFEVLTSEASYCRSLDIVVEHFVKSKQLGSLLTTQDRNWLFSRLADVRAISHSFLSKLEERVESDIVHFTVCDIIARHCQRFRMVYVPYLTNQSYQDATYQRLMNENQGFKRIVDKLERSPVCQRLPLRSFLVLPFQRITRIKLLVQNIVKRTTPATPEATQAIKALKLLEKLIQESNDSISQMKSIESLVSLSAKVDFECRTLPLISQSRRLVREGPVTELMDFSLKDKERSVYLHLFNDYLLVSLQKEGGRFTVIDHSPISDLRVENCRVKLHSLQKNLFRLHMSQKALLLRTDTQSDKLRWISALSPTPEIDFSTAQDFPQMQCIRALVAQQPDELSLEKADIILVHQQSSDHWVEGTRLSDRNHGWVPESHLETISNSRVRQRNLSDALKLTTATATV
ncbi:trichohyalin isoform X1 [Echeneis naucrates]|uniref:trichohyalin isoform X1 n=1 Tax=Echeneis naucrates TaxID=173247 RepID=UPI0011141F74|nr:trichohyalin-like isoform X1 [Echeneis naucrates]